MEPIRFGANYIPSKNWLHSWINWDAPSVEEDLCAARELGVDHVRAHLMWPYFQLDPRVMNTAALAHLEEFRGICEKVGMDFCVTVFNGFVSGLFYYPAFVGQHTPHFRGGSALVTDPDLIAAEEYYLRSVASVVADSPRFLGFDLGNEFANTFAGQHFMTDEGMRRCDDWAAGMFRICEEAAPGGLHTNGLDHQPWFFLRDFSRCGAATLGGITSLHCYALFTQALERFGALSVESLHLAPFMAEVAAAYSDDPARRCWVQEFGTASSEPLDETMTAFVEGSMRAMFTCGSLWGITWWCTNNIPAGYTSFEPLEYKLGLLDSENRPTPAGELFARLAREYRTTRPAPQPRRCALVLETDPADHDNNKQREIQWRNGRRYADCVRAGVYPTFVLPEKANDAAHLAARGIEKILDR